MRKALDWLIFGVWIVSLGGIEWARHTDLWLVADVLAGVMTVLAIGAVIRDLP